MTMCVFPDGYILDAQGPYYSDSKNNDASTFKHDLDKNISGLVEFLQPGDVVIMDRGYLDCPEYLHGLGLDSDMPRFMDRTDSQLSTEDANASRVVTKTR